MFFLKKLTKLAFLVTLIVVLFTSQVSAAVTFKDVTKESYAYEAIMYLAERDIVKGYGNGYFGLKDEVTRGQVAALIARYLELNIDEEFQNPYNDVAGTMFEKEILAVTKAGLMKGKGQGNFDPNATLTRAEMAQVLTNVFDLKVKATYDFHDVSDNHWARDAIRALYSNGLTKGVGDWKFNPNGKVTREQYAEFLYRGIFLDENFVAEPIPEPPKPGKPQVEIEKEAEGWTFVYDDRYFELQPAHPETQAWLDQFIRDLKIEGNKVTGKIPKYDSGRYIALLNITEGNGYKFDIAETIAEFDPTKDHSNKTFTYTISGKYPIARLTFDFTLKEDFSISNALHVDLLTKTVYWENAR